MDRPWLPGCTVLTAWRHSVGAARPATHTARWEMHKPCWKLSVRPWPCAHGSAVKTAAYGPLCAPWNCMCKQCWPCPMTGQFWSGSAQRWSLCAPFWNGSWARAAPTLRMRPICAGSSSVSQAVPWRSTGSNCRPSRRIRTGPPLKDGWAMLPACWM